MQHFSYRNKHPRFRETILGYKKIGKYTKYSIQLYSNSIWGGGKGDSERARETILIAKWMREQGLNYAFL